MSIAESLLPEFDEEVKHTRHALERIPGRPDWFALGLVAAAVLGACGFRAGAAPAGSRHMAGAPPQDPRAEIFVRSGCTECHAISAFGVKAAKDVGPDLTYSYGDVLNRYGISLEAFLYDPSGVMRMMLASHLRLSAVDRDSMVQVLRVLYEQRRGQLDSSPPP